MIQLGVNGWRMQGPRTGVPRYLYNIVRHWTDDVVPKDVRVTFHAAKPFDDPLPSNIKVRIRASDSRMLVWENLRLGPSAKDDVLFCPSFSRPVLTRARTVVTLHDAVSALYPHLFPKMQPWLYNPLYGWSGRNATLVITDSEAARDDICNVWRVPESKIRVIYMAPAEHFQAVPDRALVAETCRQITGSDAPYFLFVGKTSGRRNLPLLLDAFALWRKRQARPHRLCLVGPSSSVALREQVARLGIGSSVLFSGFQSDENLNLLYNGAQAMVMPSVYETVSLPVLEAQAAGTPVVCIGTAGMLEVSGRAALTIPRLEPTLLADAMDQIADGEALREDLCRRGLLNTAGLSWKKTAKQTLDVLLEAATA